MNKKTNTDLITLSSDYMKMVMEDIRLLGWENRWFKITKEWLKENYKTSESLSNLIGFDVKYYQKNNAFDSWESSDIKFTFRSPSKKTTEIKATYRGGCGNNILLEKNSSITIII